VITIAARTGRKPTAAEFLEAKLVYREIRDGSSEPVDNQGEVI